MPQSSHPFHRAARVGGVLLVALSALGVVGCSSSKSAQESLDELHLSDDPKVVVATAVERLDPTVVLGHDLVSDYLRVKFALRGYSWADAACAVDRVRTTVTSERLDVMPLARIDDLAYDVPGLEADLRTCASPESLARLDQKPDRSTTTTKGQPRPTAATDIDGATVTRMSKAFYALTAKDIGLTTKERDCMFDAAFGGRSDDDMVKLLLGVIPTSIEQTAAGVAACLSTDRFDKITPIAAKELLARKDAVDSEHARVQALLDASVASSTTTTVASSPATSAAG